MTTTKSVLTPTILAASLMAAFGNAWSADAAVDELIKPSSSVSIGVGGWNDNRAKLGAFDAMRKKDSYLLLDADIRKRDDATGTWTNLTINNLGSSNREIRGEYLRQGGYGVTIEYSEFQSKAPYTINTNQLGMGTNTQTTGTNIPNTAIGSGSNYQFGTDRDKLGFSFFKNLIENLDLNVKVSSENKKGNRITANGTPALFVADLIDWKTTKAEASLDYKGDLLRLSGGYSASWFKNNNPLGYVSLGGLAGQLMTQPLDNEAHQAFLGGSYDFTPTTKANFKVAYTKGTQNEPLATTSSLINATTANIPNIQGRVDTTLVQFGLTARPMPKLSLVANLRYQDVKDKTPQYTVVRSTNNAANLNMNTTPYSYKTTTGKLEATYRLPENYSLVAGAEYKAQTRSVFTTMGAAAYNPYVPMRERNKELTYQMQVRKSLSETLNGSLAYLQGTRTGSDYQASTQAQTNLVSPVNTADRDREKLRFAMDWSPVEKLGVQFSAETAQDRYGSASRSHGLHRGSANTYSFDLSYQISDAWQVSGWYSRNTNNAHFRNSTSATVSNIQKQNDTGDLIGLKLHGSINSKTTTGAELTHSNDRTAFDLSTSNGAATGAVAPDISSKVTRLKLFANHNLQKNSDIRFDVGYEKWQTNDWQWNYTTGLPWQFGTATDGTTVITTPKQDATFVSVRYIYKFQ
jgi:MtrB/PioB family decaheme-associated outer membrane protein